ncbi:hypothetical protein BKA57DRAFT_19040 [Linnemannia elongata]|nr:hypothetical protein BKA57DRAFT_19040 [Linnemannia elongata]
MPSLLAFSSLSFFFSVFLFARTRIGTTERPFVMSLSQIEYTLIPPLLLLSFSLDSNQPKQSSLLLKGDAIHIHTVAMLRLRHALSFSLSLSLSLCSRHSLLRSLFLCVSNRFVRDPSPAQESRLTLFFFFYPLLCITHSSSLFYY